ncbi:ROK family protein [bacterium]|nr:MAG: ROK family protein [bacterium]
MSYSVGIDLGGTNLKISLVDNRYKIKDKKILNTQNFVRKEELISAVVNSVNSLIQLNKLRKSDISGVGLGLPGPIDNKKGIVHFFPNISGWKNVKLVKILAAKLKLPVFIDNDANMMTLAEYRLGAARGARNAVCLTLGTGVGGGIIIEGRIFRGSINAGGEIGHMPVNEKGPKCNCGGQGCLETYIGNKVILEKARKIFGKNITLEETSRLAAKGERRAKKLWQDVGKCLGVTLSAIVNLINPDRIIIGGGVAKAGSVLFDSVKNTIKERAMPVQAAHVKIFKAILGNDAGMVGAAIMASEAGKI